ncbi:50S ribosomal protein L18 [Membranihabitans maritimus]|uniref:50S ribosomal protein L18 n=1 Tax=Membranihabitans maritimus TaxID=2904244 RepID=UPI001F022C36|nr:50S ribosomal protein L18 [Membranihabitans maritimus]
MKLTKAGRRQRIKKRIKKSILGTAERPRLAVYKSNKGISCQVINDDQGTTIVSASWKEKDFTSEGTKTDQAKKIGQLIAERAKANNLESVIFDRSGYRYHGRVKALAEGAREGGLKF